MSKETQTVHHMSEKTGLPPGTLVYVGDTQQHKTFISIMDYDNSFIEEHLAQSAKDCYPFKDSHSISWINIDGLKDIDTISQVGQHFGLDMLLLEDVLNTEQRPKVEVFDKRIFFTLKMLSYDQKSSSIDVEQLSFVIGENFVLSFQERPGDVFEPVRSRLRNHWGHIRSKGSDYLIYSLIDVIVDNYFTTLEELSKEIEGIEDIVFESTRTTQNLMKVIQQNKKQIQLLQRSITPLRDAISKIQRNEAHLIDQNNAKYFNDLRDHTIQVIDNIGSCYDLNTSMQEIYLSSLSHKMNQVIQVLTIISTLFIPLTFIVGVYGMNFRHMPELHWRYGYWVVWSIMGCVVAGLLYFFRKKGWI